MNDTCFEALDATGLNLHAVFAVDALPEDVRERLPRDVRGQLILIGHYGPGFWHALQSAGIASGDPIDAFSQAAVTRWLVGLTGAAPTHWLYPGETTVGLQRLGALAGWHHAAPFKVGVNARWGSWFAYRALLIADTDLPLTPPARANPHPCHSCATRPCVSACPARAMDGIEFDLTACLDHRTAPASSCAATCLARLACPLGAEHRYPTAQIAHSYRHSLTMIRAWRAGTPGT